MNSLLTAVILHNLLIAINCHPPGPPPSGRNNPKLRGLNDDCLRCLCAASSECDPLVRCHSVGPVEYYCGPYQFSQRYWLDAGAPGSRPNDPMDFEDCANDIDCSIRTVTNYMAKHARDCDRDGWITCEDFAMLHKAGPRDCKIQNWMKNTKFYQDYKTCAVASGLV